MPTTDPDSSSAEPAEVLAALLGDTGGLLLLPAARPDGAAPDPPDGWRCTPLLPAVRLGLPAGLDNRTVVQVRDQARAAVAASARTVALQAQNRALTGQVDALLHALEAGQVDESGAPELFAFLPGQARWAVLKDGAVLVDRGIDEHSLRVEARRMQTRFEHECPIADGHRYVCRREGYVAVVDSDHVLDPVQRRLVRLSLSQLAAHRALREQHELIERVRTMIGGTATGAAAPSVEQQVGQLMDATVRDSLTRIYNRSKITDVLAGLERSGRAFSVVLADIDHFKSVNDSFGHLAGDRVIVEVAGCLQAGSRPDDVVARWGGEEFVAVLPDTGLTRAQAVAERWRAQIAATVQVSDRRVTCSFGVAEQQAGEPAEVLFHRADQALYRAKQAGRNRVRVDVTE